MDACIEDWELVWRFWRERDWARNIRPRIRAVSSVSNNNNVLFCHEVFFDLKYWINFDISLVEMQGLWNLIGKVGQGSTQAFPYEIGDKISGLDGKSIWSLHKGKKKVWNIEISVVNMILIVLRKFCTEIKVVLIGLYLYQVQPS